jgi:hypothetical protein
LQEQDLDVLPEREDDPRGRRSSRRAVEVYRVDAGRRGSVGARRQSIQRPLPLPEQAPQELLQLNAEGKKDEDQEQGIEAGVG